VCPRCAGRIESDPVIPAEGDRVRVEYVCEHCRHRGDGPLVGRLIKHPAVVSAFYEQGVEVNDLPYWELRRRLDDVEEELVEANPLRVCFTVPLQNGQLELLVDGAGEVIEVERSDSPRQ
jgi:hypothetical protein